MVRDILDLVKYMINMLVSSKANFYKTDLHVFCFFANAFQNVVVDSERMSFIENV